VFIFVAAAPKHAPLALPIDLAGDRYYKPNSGPISTRELLAVDSQVSIYLKNGYDDLGFLHVLYDAIERNREQKHQSMAKSPS
jgi:hypothetical protein